MYLVLTRVTIREEFCVVSVLLKFEIPGLLWGLGISGRGLTKS
jgi:hypothetical protein